LSLSIQNVGYRLSNGLHTPRGSRTKNAQAFKARSWVRAETLPAPPDAPDACGYRHSLPLHLRFLQPTGKPVGPAPIGLLGASHGNRRVRYTATMRCSEGGPPSSVRSAAITEAEGCGSASLCSACRQRGKVDGGACLSFDFVVIEKNCLSPRWLRADFCCLPLADEGECTVSRVG